MRKKIICLVITVLSSSLLLSQKSNLVIEKMDGVAYIEKKGGTDALRAFRGSVIKEASIIKTDSSSVILLSINLDNKRVGSILLMPSSSILLNSVYFSFDKSKVVSISLISGKIEALVTSSENNNISIHSATASVLIDKAVFGMKFTENVVTLVYLKDGLLSIETDYDNKEVNPYEMHISSYLKPSEIKKYKYGDDTSYNDLFSIEEDAISDGRDIPLDNYFVFMKDISKKYDTLNKYDKLSDNGKGIDSFISMESKHHRVIVANEAFFTIIRRTMQESNKNSDEMIKYAKLLLLTYNNNNKLIDKTSNYIKAERTRIKEPVLVDNYDDVIISH